MNKQMIPALVTAVIVGLSGNHGTLAATVNAPQPSTASATMPLSTYIELFEKSNVVQAPKRAQAPVSALVQRAELHGKLTDDAVLFSARMSVTVLDATDWVSVPILTLTKGTVIEQMPQVDRAHFVVNDNRLEFLSKRLGQFDFTFRFIERATIEAQTRKVSIELAAPALSQCKIQFDRTFFKLSATDFRQHGDDAIVFPRDKHCQVSWAPKDTSVQLHKRAEEAPQAAPVITAAHASLVTTMEGDRLLRALYRLQFSGAQKLTISLTPNETVSRLFLNGHTIAGQHEDNRIVVDVHPSDAGDADATLELVTMSSGHGYLLKGAQFIRLPALSWPTNVLNLIANLPAVFNYKWRAGTLAPVKPQPDVAYTHDIPTPGKSL